ncbi:MAG: hypothetical protein Q9M89_00085 [Persephonella sp.]|nr:hypothetical protein [Persephonella sp.]
MEDNRYLFEIVKTVKTREQLESKIREAFDRIHSQEEKSWTQQEQSDKSDFLADISFLTDSSNDKSADP